MLTAVRRDRLRLEREMAADVDEERRARLVALRLGLEVGERHTQVLAVAVDELHGRRRRPIAASGVAMNVFDGHSTVSPCTPREVQRGQRAAGPAEPVATASTPL